MNIQAQEHTQVLIVDDEAHWLYAFSSILKDSGYSVLAVRTSTDAKLAIDKNKFDLIIIDVRLISSQTFNVDGLEVLHYAKSQRVVPKIILTTAFEESINRSRQIKEYAPDLFLPKTSFDLVEFVSAIHSLLPNVSLKK